MTHNQTTISLDLTLRMVSNLQMQGVIKKVLIHKTISSLQVQRVVSHRMVPRKVIRNLAKDKQVVLARVVERVPLAVGSQMASAATSC